MDEDDLNMLAGIQRSGNLQQNEAILQQNEATRQSIEGLREDLRRKEREEAAAPKCPYCFGAISYGAAKCRHCASDIQYVEVQGRHYFLKAEDNAKLFVQQKTHEFAEELARQKRMRAKEANYLASLPKCIKCGAPIEPNSNDAKYYKTKGKRCFSCYDSSPMARIHYTLNVIAFGIVLIPVVLFVIWAMYRLMLFLND